MAEFKKFSETEKVESMSDTASVLVEDGGEIKRIPAEKVGGGAVTFHLDLGKGLVYKNSAMSEPITEQEIKDAFENGINLDCYDTGFTAKVMSCLWDMGDGQCEIHYFNPESVKNATARNYTGDGEGSDGLS